MTGPDARAGAAVRDALQRPYRSIDGIVFDPHDLAIEADQDEVRLTLTVRITPPRGEVQRWAVTLTYDDVDADLFQARSAEQLDELVFLVRVHLEEWWHTRSYERQAREMGRRLG